MMKPKPVLHLFSGGLDSTVLLWDLLHQKCNVHCLLFNYGQRHANRELSAAHAILENFNAFRKEFCVLFTELELPRIGGSTLTDGAGSKVVPNRNAIFLSHAVSIAARHGAESVTIACNKDDAADFPDCRREFIAAMNASTKAAGVNVEICAPYLELAKEEIARLGRRLGAPMEKSWSCYEGSLSPCQKCDACKKRAEVMTL